MVVTDLHGDWDAYQRYRDRFLELQTDRRADCLVFTGDLIHRQADGKADHSLEIVLDVLDLQEKPGEAVIYLCGNHELPHIYGFGLGKGHIEYTPDFEARLSHSGKRAGVVSLFQSLPMYIRTAAGVSLTHAGASRAVNDLAKAHKLFAWDHQKILENTEVFLRNEDIASLRRAYAKLNQADSYDALAKHYLAITGPSDPRYNDLLRGAFVGLDPDYDLLYSALFTKCEGDYGSDYGRLAEKMLMLLSEGYVSQEILVAGHMNCSGGYELVGNRHFRLASGSHARPPEAGLYLLFDASRKLWNAVDLQGSLYSIYE